MDLLKDHQAATKSPEPRPDAAQPKSKVRKKLDSTMPASAAREMFKFNCRASLIRPPLIIKLERHPTRLNLEGFPNQCFGD